MSDGFFKGDPAICCHTCVKERDDGAMIATMILCTICGNKRCPHATDHRLECTHSNEPGQPGSVYEAPPSQEQESGG